MESDCVDNIYLVLEPNREDFGRIPDGKLSTQLHSAHFDDTIKIHFLEDYKQI